MEKEEKGSDKQPPWGFNDVVAALCVFVLELERGRVQRNNGSQQKEEEEASKGFSFYSLENSLELCVR
ncbi:hypothetical protein PanWU01x14_246210 [Parasponia andersonii]|uniref:Uncharacterized protein n=1 Tax=Parasponia andersonii TaxID=3476 RepID=A0A2P5BEM3_PARAD|nr:hypothetical protein PanWU01x14_246210 [Parasponia andersonii]